MANRMPLAQVRKHLARLQDATVLYIGDQEACEIAAQAVALVMELAKVRLDSYGDVAEADQVGHLVREARALSGEE